MMRVAMELCISRSIDTGRPLARPLRSIARLWPALRRFETDARRVDAALRQTAGAFGSSDDATPPGVWPTASRIAMGGGRGVGWRLAAAAVIALAAGTACWTTRASFTIDNPQAGLPAMATADAPSVTAPAGPLATWVEMAAAARTAPAAWSSQWQQRVETWTQAPLSWASPPVLIDAAAAGLQQPIKAQWLDALNDLTNLAARFRQAIPLDDSPGSQA